MEDVSITAFWLGVVAVSGATLLTWAHLLGVRLAVRRMPALSYAVGATEMGEGPVVATIERGEANGWTDSLGRLGAVATWTALLFLLASVGARWDAVGHAPWSNMYEFTVAFATAVLIFYCVFDRVYGRLDGGGVDRERAARTLGAVALPVVVAMLLVAALFFPSEIRPLVPALQNSDLLTIHVAMMILAYGALSVSFAAAVLYLVQGGERNRPDGRPSGRFSRLPNAQLLDDLAYRSVMVGFPLLALGVALGAYWANSAWGRYWGWDPKETSALVTWLIYGIYLHMRGLRGWAGTRSAVVLVVGFGAVMFTYFVVNLWVSGLHSYAGV